MEAEDAAKEDAVKEDASMADEKDTPDQSAEAAELAQKADVASSDDPAPADVPSGSVDAVQTAISSSTAEADESHLSLGNPAISSSDAESSDLLPSTSSNALDRTNGEDGLPSVSSLAADPVDAPEAEDRANVPMENVDEHPDTSVAPIEDVSVPIRRIRPEGPIIINSTGSRTIVSSSNASIALLHHQVSSTNSDLINADESAVSSSMNSNGNIAINSVGTHETHDALATLASAALNRQQSTKELKLDQEEPWYTVGIVKGTSFTVSNYIADPNIDLSKLTLDNIPDLSGLPVVSLEPGTGYKFRIAAINSCGRGEFGEESAFKTCVPGYPGAPSAIKISKSAEGAHLSWEPPQVSSEGIFEYSVYLAVKPTMNTVKDPTLAKSQLTFVRVYCGKANTCIVPQVTLGNAHVDNSTKPAIIFRIAARNDKGYGPATQVRWLQENKSTGAKRVSADGRPPNAPPSKQQKTNIIH